ncbi:MAG: DUF134 domain-containing protein [Candidatus Altiarchaeales archaeon]|nr:DUF134 domain-containing protein [Candidatus Altiarchaeales archaeon]MBD3417324.1 DUF134 domain-containing protein [Candidatus Altiarchaeales archaeon]
MGRPKCLRKVSEVPGINYFKPRGIPLTELEGVELKVEELEAMKLVYYDREKREQAAKRMGVSRRTMERELKSGLSKVIEALLYGKAIEIRGGYYVSDDEMVFRCLNDKHEWKAEKSMRKPRECPECSSKKIKVREE